MTAARREPQAPGLRPRKPALGRQLSPGRQGERGLLTTPTGPPSTACAAHLWCLLTPPTVGETCVSEGGDNEQTDT